MVGALGPAPCRLRTTTTSAASAAMSTMPPTAEPTMISTFELPWCRASTCFATSRPEARRLLAESDWHDAQQTLCIHGAETLWHSPALTNTEQMDSVSLQLLLPPTAGVAAVGVLLPDAQHRLTVYVASQHAAPFLAMPVEQHAEHS